MERLAWQFTVELTLGCHTRANVYDLAAGVAALPPLPNRAGDGIGTADAARDRY